MSLDLIGLILGTRSQQKTTIYHETSSPEDILLKLNPILAPAEDYFMNLSQMLEQVKIFVTLETFRRCFVKDNVNVVIGKLQLIRFQ